jgi:hypothetical protein
MAGYTIDVWPAVCWETGFIKPLTIHAELSANRKTTIQIIVFL